MTTPDMFSHWIHSMGANTPTRGWRRRWTSLYCLHTADAPDVARVGDFLFLWDLQEKQESRQADSNRLPLLQLRVCGQWLLGVAGVCKYRISKGLSILSIAPYRWNRVTMLAFALPDAVGKQRCMWP